MISWIQPSRFTVSGGGGGGTPAFIAGASLATAYSTNNGTTASFSAAGTDPVIFGSILGREPASPSPVLSECRYGGSGGTLMTLMTSANREFASTSTRAGRYIALPGPNSSSTIYATFSSASLGTIVQGVAFENVSGYDSVTTNAGNTTGTTALLDVTVTGISSGDVIVAHFGTIFENNNGLDFNNTGITDNVILTQPSAGESRTWVGGVWVMRESTGSSCTVQINATQGASEIFNWDAYAFRLVPA